MGTTIRKIRRFFGQNDARPLITVDQLAQELLRTTVIVMILLGIPHNILALLTFAYFVWILHVAPVSIFFVQLVGAVFVLAVPAYLVRKSPFLALNFNIGVCIIIIYLQTIITNDTVSLGAIISVLALPSIAISWKHITKIMTLFTLGFFTIIYLDPNLIGGRTWVLGIGSIWLVIGGFMILGIGFQHIISKYTETIVLQQKEMEARIRAETSNTYKSQFLAHMSHELRTPLNSIIGYSEYILMDKREPLSGQKKEFLEGILDEGVHLLQLINNVLDVSKIEAGKLEIQPESLEIKGVLERVEQSLGIEIRKKGLELHIENRATQPLWADETRLYQIFLNLLSNAIKFTPQGRITIDVSQDEAMAIIAIADTGIGIAPADLETVFDSFEQVQGTYQREFEGTGLGLSIAKQLIELHGGQIWVTSEVDKGSEFCFSIPLAPAHHRAFNVVREAV